LADLTEASTQGQGSYGVWRHVPSMAGWQRRRSEPPGDSDGRGRVDRLPDGVANRSSWTDAKSLAGLGCLGLSWQASRASCGRGSVNAINDRHGSAQSGTDASRHWSGSAA
jgi:hypothetical protein